MFVTGGAVVDTLDLGWWNPEAKPGETPRHERLRMDGRLKDSFGKVTTVDVSVTPTSRRFALPAVSWILYDEWEAAYEDTDDGRALAARLSTGSHEMAPPVFTAPGACAMEGGALRPVRRRAADPGPFVHPAATSESTFTPRPWARPTAPRSARPP